MENIAIKRKNSFGTETQKRSKSLMNLKNSQSRVQFTQKWEERNTLSVNTFFDAVGKYVLPQWFHCRPIDCTEVFIPS